MDLRERFKTLDEYLTNLKPKNTDEFFAIVRERFGEDKGEYSKHINWVVRGQKIVGVKLIIHHYDTNKQVKLPLKRNAFYRSVKPYDPIKKALELQQNGLQK